MAECNWQPREAMLLLYQQTETNVGRDIYVCIQCFREEYPGQESCSPYRQSSPYVLSRQHGSRKVIPGSVYESLRNLSLQLEQLADVLRDSVGRIEDSEGEQRAEEYYQYDRHLTNSLVLISCLARNLFHTFPRLTEQFVVQMFDYEGKETDHMRVKDLLDLFVHNRYMHLHDEYITDLVSQKPPEGTVVAEGFMGHRFKIDDFLVQIQGSIESVTIKDLTTRLRSVVKSLNLDTPYQEILFLVQNTESFSDLLEATIQSGSYGFIFNALFAGTKIPDVVRAVAKGDEIKQVIKFRNPRVEIGNRVDEKKVKIRAKSECAYLVAGCAVLKTTEERSVELDYEDFFNSVVQTFGQERLLDMARRIEGLRKAAGGAAVSR